MSDNPSIVPQGQFKFWDFQQRRHVFTDEVLQLSATDIKTGRECMHKLVFKFTGHKGPKNHYLAMGSAFHSVIEDYLVHKAKTGKVKPWNEVMAIFEGFWTKEAQGVVFGKISEQRAKCDCVAFIQCYYQQALPMLNPLFQAKFRPKDSIERFFLYPGRDETGKEQYLTHNGLKLKFSGKVDLIDKAMFCDDHKTTGNLSNWTQADADNEIQPYLYPYCLKQLGVDIKGFRFYVTDGKSVKVYEVKYDESKVAGILQEAFKLKEDIESGNLQRAKNSRSCSWCEFKDICEEKIV